MPIPGDWLWHPVTVAEVEEDLATLGAPDSWLRQWRALLDHRASDDELWTYLGCEPTPDGEGDWFQEGFALVRDGEVVDWIGTPF